MTAMERLVALFGRVSAPAILSAVFVAPADAQQVTTPPTWDLQFAPPITLSRQIDYLDLDPDNHSAAQIAALLRAGITPICYVSVGTLEDYRSDKAAFPAAVVGKVYGDWPDERFLDIRRRDLLVPLMRKRFERCKAKGFKAIDPDNVDAYQNDSGFPLTRADTLAYMKALAREAHALGLKIGQKNVPDLTPSLVGTFDFVVTESCYKQGWCNKVLPYARAGKPVFAIEYAYTRTNFPAACVWGKGKGISFIFKDHALTSYLRVCK